MDSRSRGVFSSQVVNRKNPWLKTANFRSKLETEQVAREIKRIFKNRRRRR